MLSSNFGGVAKRPFLTSRFDQRFALRLRYTPVLQDFLQR
jgi:hypothetical protein